MHVWRDATISGFRAMGASLYADAAANWLAARSFLGPVADDDARRAATQSNAGVAHLLLGQRDEAEIALGSAEQTWARCLDGVATGDVELSGSSSSFHISLASRNAGAFQNAIRRRIAMQCETGLAIARFNRVLAGGTPEASDASILASVLSDVLGPRSPEVQLLRANACDSPYAEKAAELASMSAAVSSAAHDRRSVERAVALTALLRPALLLDLQKPSAADAYSASPL